MLNHLYISNFALIESLEIDFSKGMSIITGETGAGKSILLGALGLVLGVASKVFEVQVDARIEEVTGLLDGLLTEEKMIKMNYEVDENKRDPKEVAIEFLKSEGIIE